MLEKINGIEDVKKLKAKEKKELSEGTTLKSMPKKKKALGLLTDSGIYLVALKTTE